MPRTTALPIVVVGAGIVGASIAYHLSTRGHPVILVDAGLPASGATGASFAWIGQSVATERPSAPLRSLAVSEYRRLEREVPGLAVEWSGALTWGGSGGTEHPSRAVSDARTIEPRLASPPPVAFCSPEEGALDPVATTDLLVAAAVTGGSRLHVGSSVDGLLRDGDAVVGVQTADGPVTATTVVLAAGTGTAALCTGIGIEVPVRSSPAVLVRLRAAPGLVHGIVASPELEIRQLRDGTLLVPLAYDGETGRSALRETARRTRDRVMRSFTDAGDVEIVSAEVGWRPMPADGEPIIGAEPGAPGLYLAAMHSGVTLAAVVGRLAAEEIVAGTEAVELDGCRRSRFGE